MITIIKRAIYILIYLFTFNVMQSAYGEKNMRTDYITDFGIEVKNAELFNMTKDLKKSIRKKLISIEKEGTQIITPEQIDISLQENFPVLWLTMESEFREWYVNSKQNNYLVITNLIDGTTEVVYAQLTKNKRLPRFFGRSSIGTPPEENTLKNYHTSAKLLDIREQSSLSWASGLYALTILAYDRQSNTETVELITKKEGSNSKFQSTPENHFTLALKQGQYGHIKSHQISDTPLKTATLTLPIKVNRQKEKLQGSIKVPINTSSLYTTEKKNNNDKYYFSTTLILTQLDSYAPFTFNFTIPINDVTTVTNKTMELKFELDLATFFNDMPDVTIQTSQVYLVVGQKIIGPQALIVE